jgi:hypothetical protein
MWKRTRKCLKGHEKCFSIYLGSKERRSCIIQRRIWTLDCSIVSQMVAEKVLEKSRIITKEGVQEFIHSLPNIVTAFREGPSDKAYSAKEADQAASTHNEAESGEPA